MAASSTHGIGVFNEARWGSARFMVCLLLGGMITVRVWYQLDSERQETTKRARTESIRERLFKVEYVASERKTCMSILSSNLDLSRRSKFGVARRMSVDCDNGRFLGLWVLYGKACTWRSRSQRTDRRQKAKGKRQKTCLPQ